MKPKSNRDIMRDSNTLARDYILEKLNGNQVWIKPHYRFSTTTYCRDYSYKTQDVWNLLDGFCSWKKKIYGLQIKTGVFDSVVKHQRFFSEFGVNLPILIIKVDKETGEVWHKEVPEALNITTPKSINNVSGKQTQKAGRVKKAKV